MEFTYSTPALLFPAISLLFISYTNRFISYADLVRRLHERWRNDQSAVVAGQIQNLRRRIGLIRAMQLAGALALALCVVCMVALFLSAVLLAEILFAASLVLMLLSLLLLVLEVHKSIGALNLQLQDLQNPRRDN
jgi:hypothetical protein